MAEVRRVTAEDIGPRVLAGAVLLVCAYKDDAKFAANHLEGAIPFSEFQIRIADMDQKTPIVFYCA